MTSTDATVDSTPSAVTTIPLASFFVALGNCLLALFVSPILAASIGGMSFVLVFVGSLTLQEGHYERRAYLLLNLASGLFASGWFALGMLYAEKSLLPSLLFVLHAMAWGQALRDRQALSLLTLLPALAINVVIFADLDSFDDGALWVAGIALAVALLTVVTTVLTRKLPRYELTQGWEYPGLSERILGRYFPVPNLMMEIVFYAVWWERPHLK